MANDNRQSDIVNEAFEGLRRSPLPPGPSPQALEQILRAVNQAQEKPIRVSFVERIRRMNKFIKYPVAAGLVLAVLAGAYVFLMPGSTVAFAQVRDLIEKMQTMTCRVHLVYPAADGRPMELDIHASYSLPHLMRQEIAMSGIPGATVVKVINIYDLQAGKALNLNPSEKTATVLNLGQLPPELKKKMTENFAEKMKALVQKDGVPIGQKEIGGTEAVGFRVNNEGVATDIWVDKAKGEKLILVEMDMPGQGHVQITDIVINPPLEASLFSLAVPEGYREVPAMNLSVENLTEKDLIAGLRFLAENNEGTFPLAPNITPEILSNAARAVAKTLPDKNPSPEALAKIQQELGSRMARMTVFLQVNSGTFRYVGSGVKLGDAKAPVCWYKPKDAALYRIIRGDLSAADIAEADLPKVENRPAPPQPPAAQGPPTVRLSLSTKTVPCWSEDGDRWDIEGTPALMLMAEMYSTPYLQAVAEGALPPGCFDVHVQASKGADFHELYAAAQQALEKQLGLTARYEQRKMGVYLLKAPNGKSDAFKPTTGGYRSCSGGTGGQPRIVHNMSISEALTGCLEMRLGRPVLDETGIKGAFDYQVALPAEGKFEDIAKAVKDGLGLELVPAERSVMC